MPSDPSYPAVAVVVVQLSLAIAAAAVTVAVVTLARAAESGQTIAYLTCFFVLLPSLIIVGRPLGRVLNGLGSPGAAIVSAAGASGILAVVIVARVASDAGADAAPVLLGGMAAWCVGGALAFGIARLRPQRVRWLLDARPRAEVLAWSGAAAVAVACMFSFVPERLRAPGPVGVSMLLAGALIALVVGTERVRLRRGAGVLVDALVLVVIVLGVMDVSLSLVQLPYRALLPVSQGFYLGPVNDVLHGRAVLVDTFSQYGIGVIYFLAAAFKVIPLGYGPMNLISGGLTGLAFAAGYASLRLAGCGRGLAAAAFIVGVAITQLSSLASVTVFPSTGALRFGPAYLVVLAVVMRARWPSHDRELRIVELALMGASAVWSAEALAYALAILMAAHGFEAASSEGRRAARWGRWAATVAWAVSVAVAAIVVLALLTRLFAGTWPDWGAYLALLNLYSGRGLLDMLVFPAISPWSTGFAVGFLYVASMVATLALAARARDRPELRLRLTAMIAMTTFGIASFSYWVTHGFPFALRWIALPAVLVGALWIDLVARAGPSVPRAVRLGGLAFGSWAAALAVVFAWPVVEQTGERTALAHTFPGTPSFRQDVGSLWHSPRIDPRSLEGEAVLRRYAPGHRPVVMLTGNDLGIEILMRSGRANALPLGHPLQSDLIPTHVLARVRRAIDRLPSGTLGLTDVPGQGNPYNPAVPSVLTGKPISADVSGSFGGVVRETVALLRRRFNPRVVARTPAGLLLFRLEPRSGPAGSSP